MSNKLKVSDLLSAIVEGFSKPAQADDRYICICSPRFMRGLRPDLWWKAKDIRKRVKTTRFRLTWGKIRKCLDPLAAVKYK